MCASICSVGRAAGRMPPGSQIELKTAASKPRRAAHVVMVLIMLAALIPTTPARADMAPPMMPPGSTLLPGGETTRVRMLAEKVTLSIDTDPADPQSAIANTEAVFRMRNLGPSGERMQARFPLSFHDGSSDGYFNYPEIPSITVQIDGKNVPTRREMQPPFNPQQYGEVRADVPWAVFDIVFPPDTDVTVQISYTVQGYGYFPQLMFDYVLETGAGWNGTIGSADIIVRLPYEANAGNILLEQTTPANSLTQQRRLSGNELRWHFADLEPSREDNIQVVLLAPALWSSVLKESDIVGRNPNDGEAWGRLAKAYKESARYPKGWLREDATGKELLELSGRAYQRCLELLPKDPLWHYGHADLLWSQYYWLVRSSGAPDSTGLLPDALAELQTTLKLDPDNAQAIEMLEWIRGEVPGSLERAGSEYIFLALTSTPLPPTPYLPPASATPMPAPVSTLAPTRVAVETTPEPLAANPLCGAGVLPGVLLPAAVLVGRRRRLN